ncbi:MAG: class I SAM-dependent methyltransferase [Lawsonibacter sp.]|nr:class I SAM-dependent methyltransferase [Lawsonibacter sp.]
MSNYYAENLNSQKLFQVYDTAIPRVRQYFDAEIDFVRQRLKGHEHVLELGAGYGRIVRELAPYCASIVGMDISEESVHLGASYLQDFPNADMIAMDVHEMNFSHPFDVILCLQNGLSAMRADDAVIQRVLSYLAPGGTAYFSTYSANFWDHRLAWFQEQADKGLLGELDMEQTKNGVIVCKDGFRATTHSPADLESIGRNSGLAYEVTEVDESSLFLILHNPG